MKRKEDKRIKAVVSGHKWGIIIGTFLICFALATRMIPTPIVIQDDGKHWQIIWEGTLAEAAEVNPTGDADGFLEIFFINVSTSPGADYSRNNTANEFETWCTANMPGKTPYASIDNFNLEVDHSTSFNILVRCRFNKTHAWNGTAFIANDTRCEMQVNSSNWADGEDITNATDGVVVPSRNDSGDEHIWINFYWDDGDGGDGGGFQLAKNGVMTVARIYISANF